MFSGREGRERRRSRSRAHGRLPFVHSGRLMLDCGALAALTPQRGMRTNARPPSLLATIQPESLMARASLRTGVPVGTSRLRSLKTPFRDRKAWDVYEGSATKVPTTSPLLLMP
jgi:hypothetical protein